ncbi:MAG: hypothetical protein HYS07_08735 [Chlamydiae bacterium]|nr:hypothetical protein [Chlamydiota bacterium]MBI3277883.1 hypothetical protein [Chlamydiota bacterium]
MGFAADMTNLAESFVASFNDRINFLGHNVAEVNRITDDAHKFLDHTRKDRKAMARELYADLGTFVGDLTDNVGKLCQGFRKENRAFHQECKAGHQAFQKVAKTMAEKRRHFDASVNNMAEKAAPKTTNKKHK